jgi:hypothetical protein
VAIASATTTNKNTPNKHVLQVRQRRSLAHRLGERIGVLAWTSQQGGQQQLR